MLSIGGTTAALRQMIMIMIVIMIMISLNITSYKEPPLTVHWYVVSPLSLVPDWSPHSLALLRLGRLTSV